MLYQPINVIGIGRNNSIQPQMNADQRRWKGPKARDASADSITKWWGAVKSGAKLLNVCSSAFICGFKCMELAKPEPCNWEYFDRMNRIYRMENRFAAARNLHRLVTALHPAHPA